MNCTRTLEFLLYEMLDVGALCNLPRYRHHDRQSFDQVIAAAERLAREKFESHAALSDAQEPELRGSGVWIIPEVGQALRDFADAGFLSMGFDIEHGGMQLPWVIVQACYAQFDAANVGTFAYAMLTIAAANLLARFGTDAQRTQYLRPMLDGSCFGTMCLSEPDVGSSLADVKMRAIPQSDGSYRLTGSKMWISGGEHELADNIIHMVLARIVGAPPGTRGISLFLVPRYRTGVDGSRQPNDVTLVGLNHKMGYRATVSTLLNFGERGHCVGHLIGAANHGLRQMFHMMNEARIAVGLSATMLAYRAYAHALDYAKHRRQGRLPDCKDPLSAPVPIIAHADVKRLLLAQKASIEGSLALALYCALLVDELRTDQGADRRDILCLLDLLTPIAKSWPAEFCLEANKHAIQVLGGYGYSREFPVERLYRDNRLNAIHEGTHGIQAVDLLHRKVSIEDGRALSLLMHRIAQTISAALPSDHLRQFALQLEEAAKRATEITRLLVGRAAVSSRNLALANAGIYLDMLGHIVIAWMLLRQACAAERAMRRARATEGPFYVGKVRACRYFYLYELPKCRFQADLLARMDDTCLSLSEEAF